MNRIRMLMMSAVLAVLPETNAAAPVNIIYFNADDLGIMDVGFMGRKEYNTPNLDRLAAEGMVFTEAYAPAANCAPSRAACMSGQYAARHGVYTVGSSERGKASDRKLIPVKNTQHLPEENVTMAEALKAGGYKTIHLGKWHLGVDPKDQGFDVNIGGGATGGPSGGGYFSPFESGPMKPFSAQYPKGTHRCDIFADHAIQFMQANTRSNRSGQIQQPFFMYMAYYAVHAGLQAVPDMVKKYQNTPGINPAYASMIEKMDESIGKIVSELDRLGLKENTLILFTSDNGGLRHISKQDPYRSGKGSYFEGGIREPLLVRWPGTVKANTTCSVPVIGIDFYPTFLEAAGLDVPAGKVLDGVSLMPLLTQTDSIKKRALFWHFPIYLQKYAGVGDDAHDPLFRTRPGSAMRLGKWKLHEYFEDGRLELYDISMDAGERRNLAEEMPDQAKALQQKLSTWREEIDAPVPTRPNPKYQSNAAISTGKPSPPSVAKKNSISNLTSSPNVIYILADDLGMGDLGCYGQQKLKTPNIDRLANEGMLFTDHYSGNTVCSPSRAVLMTGQHPGRVHCRGNGGEASAALDSDMTTLPRLFKNAGYATGAYGKWGLGQTCDEGAVNPMTHGFDHFTGWKNQGVAHTYYPTSIVRDGVEVPLPEGTYIHDLIMDDAFDFIQQNAKSDTPFFCYIPTAIPHAAMHAPPELHEKWRKVYPQFDKRIAKYGAPKGEPCPPVTNPIAGFAGMMENFDNQIGALLNLLAEMGVDDNTIILFSSDNGAHKEGGHNPEFWDSNGPLRGLKRDLYEGGIRVPLMARWPGQIAAGSRSDHLSAFWDLLPTMAELTGQPVPEQSDGISILPTLLGKEQQPKHEYLYHEFILARHKDYTARSLRQGDWKAVQIRDLQTKGLQAIELYNLKDDLGESTNLATQFPELVSKLEKYMDEAHTPLTKNK